MSEFERIYEMIARHPSNAWAAELGYVPVYTASKKSRIIIVGQAPGRKAQESRKPWNDASGIRLRSWLGVNDDEFYNPDLFALIPMDFYYPGKGKHGDLPPRKDFAAQWHPLLRAQMPDVQLILLVGSYSQKYYLGNQAKANLSQTVHAYEDYLPTYMPLVHPSPLNYRWLTLNPWFEEELVPALQQKVTKILRQ